MKSKILKLSSLLLAVISLFLLSITNAYAASSYDIASSITFSSDMNIDEGFDLIKPFMLYQNGQPCTSNYTFNYESLGNNRYQYTGTYPDGSTFSRQVSIYIIDDASGTYVSALMTQNYFRQSIYVKDLKQGKTVNDCLLECWRDRFVCIKEPSYSVFDQPTQNIYPVMTSFENAAGTHQLIYYAIIENVNYTPDENPDDNANDVGGSGSNTNQPTDDPSLDDPIIPDDGTSDGNENNNPPQTGEENNNNNQNNNNNNDNQQPNQQPQDPSDNTNVKDDSSKIKTILIVTGSVVGIGLIYLLYVAFKAIVVWLKR